MSTYFSDQFGVSADTLEEHGAFNISLVTDLPLFIDPFLLFNSTKGEYRSLHESIITYLVFLKAKAQGGIVSDPLLRAWYCFPEVKQTWLGFSETGNQGSGLGMDFARALHKNLHQLFPEFGAEQITKGSHLEKVCLIREGAGRDNISDFVTNLIKDFLCRFKEKLALAALRPDQRRTVAIASAVFNRDTEVWEPRQYMLPWVNSDYVILSPKDLLTRDDTWINKSDLLNRFEDIPPAVPDDQLRAQVENYFRRVLVRRPHQEPTQKERDHAAALTIIQFPQLIDYYIRLKEEEGTEAASVSAEKVRASERLFIIQLKALQTTLANSTKFYSISGTTYEEAHMRISYLKDMIENKGAHRFFYSGKKPIQREKDLQILYRLVWIGTPSDVSAEVNDGRGPADFKISRGR